MQLCQALADQQVGGGFLGELLLDRGWVTALALVEALQEQLESTAAPGAAFVVRELDGDEWTVLFRATSFTDATDYVFDEVLLRRQPQRLAITHERGGREELVWNYIQEPTPKRSNEIGDILAALHAFAAEHALAS